MLEISWSEILILGIVLMVFVGPKDLPVVLRTLGKYTGLVRGYFGDIRAQFNVVLREFEIDQLEEEGGARRPAVKSSGNHTEPSTIGVPSESPIASTDVNATAPAPEVDAASVYDGDARPPMPMPSYDIQFDPGSTSHVRAATTD